jgi:serine/threonine protein kinase
MSEDEAKKIYAQLISALSYLHSKCIAHRDIKLENVMLDSHANVKLIDFGFSTQIPNTQRVRLFCGTPSYMAPEIVKKTEFCGPPTDIYASGVLLFAFFCGRFPFKGKDDKELYDKIATAELEIPPHVPEQARSLLQLLLQKEADQRPTSTELMNHPWVQSGFKLIMAMQKKAKPRLNTARASRSPMTRQL